MNHISLSGKSFTDFKQKELKLLSFGIISMLWAASSGMGAAVRINRALCQKDTRPFG